MSSEVLDEAVGEHQVEVLTPEQLVGTEGVALDRCDSWSVLSSLVEIHHGDVARLDRRPRPPNRGSAEIHHTKFGQARNVTH
jgi:hypothetical protein